MVSCLPVIRVGCFLFYSRPTIIRLLSTHWLPTLKFLSAMLTFVAVIQTYWIQWQNTK